MHDIEDINRAVADASVAAHRRQNSLYVGFDTIKSATTEVLATARLAGGGPFLAREQ